MQPAHAGEGAAAGCHEGGRRQRIDSVYTEERRAYEPLLPPPLLDLMLLLTTTPTTIPITARTMRVMKKQIQRFLRAARAEFTAFSV